MGRLAVVALGLIAGAMAAGGCGNDGVHHFADGGVDAGGDGSDAAVVVDAKPDAGGPVDGGSGSGSGGGDAGLPDGAIGVDAGATDSGIVDAGVLDAGGLDAGTVDAGGSLDAGTEGGGGGDAGTNPDAGSAVTLTDPDGTGSAGTRFGDGPADPNGPFFTSLGTNGRSCGTCHDRAAGWSVTPAGLQARFTATSGSDPIFSPNDGATSPNDDVSTLSARQAAYAVLLNKGLIRIGLPIPAKAEFTLVAVDDPYGFASATELSLFRRILPSTNLGFDSAVMWDGREPSLTSQATDATLGHAQAMLVDPSQMVSIVDFEDELCTAQDDDSIAGDLSGAGATGGPDALATQAFHLGINDPFGGDPQGGTFDPDVFTIYSAWATLTGTDAVTQRRLSIARGQKIFNTRTFKIRSVPGIADQNSATCSTCHDTPNAGNHSLDVPISLGLDSSGNRTPDLPLYTLMRTSDGTTQQTTDPARALITGAWADIGKVKVPVLRGLAARAPYFHNGIEPSLAGLVNFYDGKFGIGLSGKDKADLVVFLSAL